MIISLRKSDGLYSCKFDSGYLILRSSSVPLEVVVIGTPFHSNVVRTLILWATDLESFGTSLPFVPVLLQSYYSFLGTPQDHFPKLKQYIILLFLYHFTKFVH